METALLSSESKSDMRLLLELAKKLGVKVKSLSDFRPEPDRYHFLI